jgi:NADH-quinone oxidoreductase subunit H
MEEHREERIMSLTAALAMMVMKGFAVLSVLLGAAGWLVLAERKILGRLQARYGPNRAGKFGLLQPAADIIKMLAKEDTVPSGADPLIFKLAPAVSAASALLIFGLIPFAGETAAGGGTGPWAVGDLNVGLLFVLALSSLSVYGVALGGWASKSRYSFLGGLRGAAQMISYELSLGLSLVPVVMLAGSFSLVDIVRAQVRYPFILVQPVSLLLFLLSAAAEIKRIPFDLPEAENELGAGYHTEYSGMRFGLFFLGEYVNLLVLGGLAAVFFLGGGSGPLLPSFVWFAVKVLLLVFIMIWIRGTLPRLRYDQLMSLGWKVLLPLSLLNIVATGALRLLIKGAP